MQSELRIVIILAAHNLLPSNGVKQYFAKTHLASLDRAVDLENRHWQDLLSLLRNSDQRRLVVTAEQIIAKDIC